MKLPSDGYILLSVVNTLLRDKYSSLEELCEEEEADGAEIRARLAETGHSYDPENNCFK